MVTYEYMKTRPKPMPKTCVFQNASFLRIIIYEKSKKSIKKVLYPKMQDPKEPESIAEDIYLLTDEKCGNLIRNDLIFRKE